MNVAGQQKKYYYLFILKTILTPLIRRVAELPMSRGWYNQPTFGRPPWQPPPQRGYWGQGPMFRGYPPPRPSWDPNYFGPSPAEYQYRPQNYYGKRPRYDQFHGYPKRPRYHGYSGNSYGNEDPFYDKFMLEDPWRELLPNRGPVDNASVTGTRCGSEPAVSDEAIAHVSENLSPLQGSVGNPSSQNELLVSQSESMECPLSSSDDFVENPLCSEPVLQEPLHIGEPLPPDGHVAPSISDQPLPPDGSVGDQPLPPDGSVGDEPLPPDGSVGDQPLPSDGSVGSQPLSPDGSVGDQPLPPDGSVGDQPLPPDMSVGDQPIPPDGSVGDQPLPPDGSVGDQPLPPDMSVGDQPIPPDGSVGDQPLPPGGSVGDQPSPIDAGATHSSDVSMPSDQP